MSEPIKPVTVRFRENAKYPWIIRQGKSAVRLTIQQAMELVTTILEDELVGADE